MSFEIIKGNLFDPDLNFDAIAQGVNCQGIMGAGIAVPFRETYPRMYEEYKLLCNNYRDIMPGLMQFHHADLRFHQNTPEQEPFLIFVPHVYNLFTQIQPGRNADYELVQKSALLMRMHAEQEVFERVGLPWIGCGIGGLEKHNVEHIFRRILEDSEIQFTLVEQ